MGRPILFALDITKKSQKVVKISPKNYLNTAKDLENNDNPTGKMLNIFISKTDFHKRERPLMTSDFR